MKNPRPGEVVHYVGGLFPELDRETYTIMQVFPNGNDIEVGGNISGIMRKKSRIDFERIDEAGHERSE
jgi:hypothetical protein